MASYNLPAPRRITASNLPLPSQHANDEHAEPGVEVRVDSLDCPPIPGFDGVLRRARVATNKQVPASNDGHGDIPLDDVPGFGIVLPGGLNMYYIDVAPNSEGTMHRTTSTDYLVVISGKLSLLTPEPKPFQIKEGKANYSEPIATECHPGDVVFQRGIVHALSNRTNEWVRLLAVVVSSETNKVPVESGSHKELADAWLP
ncbi:hypothetical protein M406DRAFT_358138 [Cryphonectria parasitica EP155]|uniref:Uncharacterized protein n=1 Tax=Cryphonectria parasitica (strain ATCC 38755 / EP155) TaxID=660469 RepID=A0A9P5CKC7_CRYP1|nr:uncharacterized protein M406DRAFT_358138 [Cryphonectria parasitica EP155]KAF3761913.1 hypothetical protein M406DRAFT_358138 [Cryphonectria parasitica EP155]